MWGIFDFIANKIKEALDTVKGWISDVKDWVLDKIGEALDTAAKWISEAKEWVLREISKALDTAKGWVSKLESWVLGEIRDAADAVSKWISDTRTWVESKIGEAKDALSADVSKALQSLSKTISPLKDFIDNFKEGITSFFKDPWAFLWGVFPVETFWASVAKGLEDVVGDDKELEKAYAEIPSPFEMEKSVIDQLMGVEPEEPPQILPEIQVIVALFEQKAEEEMLEASKAWERARKAVLERLAAE